MRYNIYKVGSSEEHHLLAVLSEQYKNAVVETAFLEVVEDLKNRGYTTHEQDLKLLSVIVTPPVKEGEDSYDISLKLATREVSYGSGEPIIIVGSLLDELLKCDFTFNAIAIGEDGTIHDPFNGNNDRHNGVLKTPTDAAISFKRDPLRIIKALRYGVTMNLVLSNDISSSITLFNAEDMNNVSAYDISDELRKMFDHSVEQSFKAMHWLSVNNPGLSTIILNSGIKFQVKM